MAEFPFEKSERTGEMHILMKHLHVFVKRLNVANECFIQIGARVRVHTTLAPTTTGQIPCADERTRPDERDRQNYIKRE